MAGHSKWANIQHRKKAQDARRGKLFTKLIREITVAARSGGGADLNTNTRLRTAVDKALTANMTRETIERATRRGTGEGGGDAYEAVRYEGYGPGGVAIMVDTLTDNRNRTVGEVRHLFSKLGGNLGTDGSVSYLFSEQGSVVLPHQLGETGAYEVALEIEADDVAATEEGYELILPPTRFQGACAQLATRGIEPARAELVQRPTLTVPLDADTSTQVLKLLDALEDLDDVQQVYANAEFADEALAAFG